MSIKVEMGIPLPAKRTNNNETLNEMREIVEDIRIGDSFIVPEEFIIIGKEGKPTHVGRGIYNQFKRAGKKCAVRRIDKETNTFRIWRIE